MLNLKPKRVIEIFLCIFMMFISAANVENLTASEEFFEIITAVEHEIIEMNEPFSDEENSTDTMSTFRRGDVNGDGRVTNADSTVFAQWLIASEHVRNTTMSYFRTLAADINLDGNISVADLILLARMMVGTDIDVGQNAFSLTFNGNGGLPARQIEIVQRQSGGTARVGTLPTQPYRTGFVFLGWFDTQSQTGGTRITANTTVTRNTDIWARWIPDISIRNPVNNTTVSGERDLTVEWSASTLATFNITLQNLTTDTRLISENNFRRRYYDIRKEYLVPGNRYRFTVTATIDGIRNTTAIDFTVTNTPYFRLGLTEWVINNGDVRLLTYVTYPNETVELYIASDRRRRSVDARFLYSRNPNERENGVFHRIRNERRATPKMIINAGFWHPGSSISMSAGFNYSETFGIYYNEEFLGFNDPTNRLNSLGGNHGNTEKESSYLTTLFYYSDGTTELRNLQVLSTDFVMERINNRNKRLVFAITGTLASGTVYNGEVLNRRNSEQGRYFRADDVGAARRSMIGVTASGAVIFLAIDSARNIGIDRVGFNGGLSVDAGAEILRNMGAVTVLNLDGGGSTQMFYRDYDRVIHPPFDIESGEPVYRRIGSVFLVW